nr:hypothetical protein [uncultured Porphyromonas sp.]
MTAQTIPALHLDHPIYHIYYVYLALPSPTTHQQGYRPLPTSPQRP